MPAEKDGKYPIIRFWVVLVKLEYVLPFMIGVNVKLIGVLNISCDCCKALHGIRMKASNINFLKFKILKFKFLLVQIFCAQFIKVKKCEIQKSV